MSLLKSSYRTAVSSVKILACAGMLLGSTAFTKAAVTVDVFLTGLKFGTGKTINAVSGNTINTATSYKYKLEGKVRGTPGTPLAKIVKIGTPIKDFVEFVKPGGSKFLAGTAKNPGGTLPVTLIEQTYTKTKTIKGYGKVKFDLTVLGSIDADGFCKLDITNVSIKTAKGKSLGSVIFSKGSALTVTAVP